MKSYRAGRWVGGLLAGALLWGTGCETSSSERTPYTTGSGGGPDIGSSPGGAFPGKDPCDSSSPGSTTTPAPTPAPDTPCTPTTPVTTTECNDPATAGCLVMSELARLTDQAPAADRAQLVSDNTAFALDLYRLLSTTPGNLVFSPFSISEALAMTWAGAGGNTAAQMARALHFTLPPDRLHAAFGNLDATLVSRGQGVCGYELNVANSLWAQVGWVGSTGTPGLVRQPFLDTLTRDYGTGVHVADFIKAPAEATRAINSWVSDRTAGHIPELLSPAAIDTDTRLVLSNAVYLNARWHTRFETSLTVDEPFTLADHTTQRVKMMHASNLPATGWVGEDYTAVELPYVASSMTAVFVLPTGSLADFESTLTGPKLQALTQRQPFPALSQGLGGASGLGPGGAGDSAARPSAGVRVFPKVDSLSLPKFSFRLALPLSDQLQKLGMTDAFARPPLPDFSGIDGRRDLGIRAVHHVATIEVSESGTVATAATAVVLRCGILAPATLEVKFDRPFLFLIRDSGTGAILFLGRVMDPTR